MGRLPNNKVWEYFDYISDAVAECQKCKAKIITPGNKRNNMTRHLFYVHGINTYTTGPKADLIDIPPPRLKKPRKLKKKYIKETTLSYIIHDVNDKKTETCDESNDETLNNDQQTISDDDSLLESSSNMQTQDDHNMDPLYNKLNVETPAVKSDSKAIQNNKDELNNISNASVLNQVKFTNGASSSSYNKSTSTLDHPQLVSENCLPKDFSIHTPNVEDMVTTSDLVEKLKAEARYFNDLADLTRSKRMYVDLQCQKLRNQIESTKSGATIDN